MSVAPDAGEDSRPGQADRAQRPVPPPAPDGRPAGGLDDVTQRLRAGRRARRQALRLPQAVARRRRSISAWTDTVGRLWLGLVLLVLVGTVVWIEIVRLSEPADSDARSAADVEAARRAGGAQQVAEA